MVHVLPEPVMPLQNLVLLAGAQALDECRDGLGLVSGRLAWAY